MQVRATTVLCLIATVVLCVHLLCSMAGMYHTAARYAKGVRTLRDRVPDTWVAKGSEWVSSPLLMMR